MQTVWNWIETICIEFTPTISNYFHFLKNIFAVLLAFLNLVNNFFAT